MGILLCEHFGPKTLTNEKGNADSPLSWKAALLEVVDTLASSLANSQGNRSKLMEQLEVIRAELASDGVQPDAEALGRWLSIIEESNAELLGRNEGVTSSLRKEARILAILGSSNDSAWSAPFDKCCAWIEQALSAGQGVEILGSPLQTGIGPTRRVPSLDPATGLPTHAEAITAIRAVNRDSTEHFAGIFVVERLSLYATKFGRDVANAVLLQCSQQIATCLTHSKDVLFQWDRTTFVALLKRSEPCKAVEAELRHLWSAPFNIFFDQSYRSLYLPVRLLGKCVHIDHDPDAAIATIDKFAALHQGRFS